MNIYIVIEKKLGFEPNLIVCFDSQDKAKEFVNIYSKSNDYEYDIKSMEISREVNKMLSILKNKENV